MANRIRCLLAGVLAGLSLMGALVAIVRVAVLKECGTGHGRQGLQ